MKVSRSQCRFQYFSFNLTLTKIYRFWNTCFNLMCFYVQETKQFVKHSILTAFAKFRYKSISSNYRIFRPESELHSSLASFEMSCLYYRRKHWLLSGIINLLSNLIKVIAQETSSSSSFKAALMSAHGSAWSILFYIRNARRMGPEKDNLSFWKLIFF